MVQMLSNSWSKCCQCCGPNAASDPNAAKLFPPAPWEFPGKQCPSASENTITVCDFVLPARPQPSGGLGWGAPYRCCAMFQSHIPQWELSPGLLSYRQKASEDQLQESGKEVTNLAVNARCSRNIWPKRSVSLATPTSSLSQYHTNRYDIRDLFSVRGMHIFMYFPCESNLELFTPKVPTL